MGDTYSLWKGFRTNNVPFSLHCCSHSPTALPMTFYAAQVEGADKSIALGKAAPGDSSITPSSQFEDKESGAAPRHVHELSAPRDTFPGVRYLDPQQYGVAGSVQSIAWTTADVAIDCNWATSRSICDDTYNEASPVSVSSPLSSNSSTPSSSVPFKEMNYTPQASCHDRYLHSQRASAGMSPLYSMQKQYFNAVPGFDQDVSLDATASWASCSTWPSTFIPNSEWHHGAPTQLACTARSYSSDVETSPLSPFILPSLSRDSSISPPYNPHLFTPSASETHLEPAIVDTFAEVMRCFDQDAWSQPEMQHIQCYQPSENSSSTHHVDFSAESASLLDDLMRFSTQDAVLAGLVEAQPQFASLPPSAFELDQSAHPEAEPLVLHHPRPRRPYIPRWQCDPDYDFDLFTSSLSSKSSPRRPAVNDGPYVSAVPEDVSSDDDLDDLMDQDPDPHGDEECEWEMHSLSYPPRSYGEVQQISSHTMVGPSVNLGASVRGLGPQALLFQSIPESVKALYSF